MDGWVEPQTLEFLFLNIIEVLLKLKETTYVAMCPIL
jgi:hypothetical protein